MVKNELNNDLQLSILDFVHVYPGSNPIQSLKNLTEMVQLADRLGYKRYWFTRSFIFITRGSRQYNKDRFVIGSVANVAEKLKRLAKEALVDEIIIADFYPSQESRLNGHQLLAEAFDINLNSYQD